MLLDNLRYSVETTNFLARSVKFGRKQVKQHLRAMQFMLSALRWA